MTEKSTAVNVSDIKNWVNGPTPKITKELKLNPGRIILGRGNN